jgi:hypothetical protein
LYIKLVFSGRYWSVFLGIYHTLKEILVGTFWYHFFGRNPFFPQKGGIGPLFEGKGGTSPLFDTASPPFAEKRSSRQTSNTDQNTDRPVKSDTGKIPIPKKLLVTPWYNSRNVTQIPPG